MRPEQQQKYLDVVITTLEAGMDSGRAPSMLQINNSAFNVNATARSGYLENRPGFKNTLLNYQGDTDLQTNFETQVFQGVSYFKPLTGNPCLVAAIGGRVFKVDVAGPAQQGVIVQDISPPGNLNATNLTKAWFCQAEDFLIIQDNQSAPIIYDGGIARRSQVNAEVPEVPVGNVMAYSMGRLWVALPGGFAFVGGNIVYGEGGTSAYSGRDSVLKYSENQLINGGGAFGVPIGGGEIRAMAAVAQIDTSTGQGPLQVLTTQGGFSVNAPFDKATWFNVNYPIETVSLTGSGALNSNVTLVNGDAWFRAFDGIRSLIVARRDFGGWGNTPMSTPMNEVLRLDTDNLLFYGSSILFDNRLLMTCSPYSVFGHGVAHRGIIALDFHRLSGIPAANAMGIFVNPPPAYDGLWTGLQILQVVAGDFNGTQRAFAFVLAVSNTIQMWELSKDLPFDYQSDGSSKNLIQWSLTGASYGFADGGTNQKKLETGDLWVDKVWGRVTFNLEYRPDQSPSWQQWANWKICARDHSCDGTYPCVNAPVFRQQYRPRMKFPVPQDTCEEATGKKFRMLYECQPRLTITGPCRLKKLRLRCLPSSEEVIGECQPSEAPCFDATDCDFNPFSYVIP